MRQSVQHKLDVTWGLLLVFVVGSGTLALVLARQQRYDALYVNVVNQQQVWLSDLSHQGTAVLTSMLQGESVHGEERQALANAIERMEQNVSALQSGDRVLLREDRWVELPRFDDAMVRQSLRATRLSWARLSDVLRHVVRLEGGREARTALETIHRNLERSSHELRSVLQALSLNLERWALNRTLRLSQVQLLLMASAIVLFLLGLGVLRRYLIRPLQQMAQGIDAMRGTGQLVKLRAPRDDEFRLVAGEFNRLAETVEEQKHRLREQVETLQQMNHELEQLSRVKNRFLSTVSHQLRTPLTAIMEGTALLRDGAVGSLNTDQQDFLATMAKESHRLEDLVNSVLELASLQSGHRILTRKLDDVTVVLQETCASWRRAASSRAIHVELGELEHVFMDRAAISRVLDHLIRNALRHTSAQGCIRVNAAVRDGFVEVAVADTGPGIAPEQMSRLFEPFEHLQRTEAPGSIGTGLGLAICKEIIERHGGWIRAESVVGRGSTFLFAIPIARSRASDRDQRVTHAEAKKSTLPGVGVPVTPRPS